MSNVFTDTGNYIKDKINTHVNSTFGQHTYMVDQMIQQPMVLAEKLLKAGVTTGALTVPVPTWKNSNLTWYTTTIPFYLENNFSFSLQNQWSPLLNNPFGDILKKLTNFTGMIQNTAQITTQSRAMNSLTWNGSTFGGFNITCLFICTNRRINPVEIVQILSKTCLPATLKDYRASGAVGDSVVTSLQDAAKQFINFSNDFLQGGINLIGNAINKDVSTFKSAVSSGAEMLNANVEDIGMVAPLGYGLTTNTNANQSSIRPLPGTTCALHIGEWFHAQELVVDQISSVEYSKELIAPPDTDWGFNDNDLYKPNIGDYNNYGVPLYAKCQISLKPFTLVDLKTFDSWFVNKPLKTYMSKDYDTSSSMELPT